MSARCVKKRMASSQRVCRATACSWPTARRVCETCGCAIAVQVCARAHNEPQLLLCEACDLPYHTFCLNPPLQAIPEEAWCARRLLACLSLAVATVLLATHSLPTIFRDHAGSALRVPRPRAAVDGGSAGGSILPCTATIPGLEQYCSNRCCWRMLCDKHCVQNKWYRRR